MSDTPFPETADIETSNNDYATRFAGPTGQWLLEVQEAITRELLDAPPGARLLDVGGGHGQLAIPLCRAGYALTVLASAESCRDRIESIITSGQCAFEVGNVLQLPYPDDHFDEVLCFRLLTHCGQWPGLVKELCRVSRGAVIVDYPTSQSLNAIAPMLFRAKKRIEKNTRSWKLFRHREVLAAFADAGYRPARRKAQFFLPMVLHRALKSRKVSALLEAPFRALGFTYMWGSPVIIRMVPRQLKPILESDA